ncbi:GntR family transcriptional regulator [Herbaspirillum rhizosphaerae]|uniref:GntR family transcriptional regulator n=1 Tax=Herbaspirillum rhizosphaerae TaxID=346179 RepID=A0ABW8ZFN4_9BURK
MTTKNPPTSSRIVKVSLAEQAYEELKKQIFDQRLLPGARLNIDALSRECGISSSPLREALIRLESEELVVSSTNTGFSIAPRPDQAKIDKIMEFRLLMEAHCARAGALAASEETIAVMEKAHDTMAAMMKKGVGYKQYRSYIDLEQVFHQAIVDSADNPAISSAYRALHTILLVARLSVVPNSDNVSTNDVADEHQEILDAFKAHDPDRAEAAVRGHLHSARGRIQGDQQKS